MGVAGLFKKIKNIAKTVVNKVKNFGDKVVNTVANNSTLNKLVEVGGKVFKGIGQAAYLRVQQRGFRSYPRCLRGLRPQKVYLPSHSLCQKRSWCESRKVSRRGSSRNPL